MTSDEFGVVAIARNEGERLIACLTSVKSQTNNIIYVDSGSTDGSVLAAERIGAVPVKLDLTRPFTAGRARNEGFAALKTLNPNVRFVQFIDGDCILDQDWLEKALGFIKERKHVAIVCGRRRELYPKASVYNQLCELEWNTPVGEAQACGGDALVRVEAFETAGGFQPQLIAGEEPELCLRLREVGWKIWRLDAEMTQHDAAMRRFGQWWVRTVRCGYAFAEVSRLHWARPFGIWKRETARAVFWGGLLPAGICLGTIIHPAVIAGALAYVFQILKIVFARGPTSFQSWIYSLFMTVGKFAEFQGILKYFWRVWQNQSSALIEYK